MNGDVCRPSVQRKETLSSSAVAVKQTATNDDVWPAALTQTTNEASSRCPIIESPPGKIFLSSADNLPAKIRPARRRPGKLSAGGRFFRGGAILKQGDFFMRPTTGAGISRVLTVIYGRPTPRPMTWLIGYAPDRPAQVVRRLRRRPRYDSKANEW